MKRGVRARKDRLIEGLHKDVYRSKDKLSQPTICPKCEAVFIKGRWTWGKAEENALKKLCPACKRVNDHVPAGELNIGGFFFNKHKNEIMNLIRNIAGSEQARHPLERIISVFERKNIITVSTTGTHILRRLGNALHNSYSGDLDLHFTKGEQSIRGTWIR